MSEGERMRVAVGQFNEMTDEKLRFAAQLGAAGVQMNTPKLPGEHHWAYEDLLAVRRKVEAHGLRFEAIENVPPRWMDKMLLGGQGREEQLAHYKTTIRNMGRAGIPVLGYGVQPNKVWRTTRAAEGRGGVRVTAFDMTTVDATPAAEQRRFVGGQDASIDALFAAHGAGTLDVSAEERWANYEYMMRAVLPVAEEAGVRLALHPADPPVPSLGGVARIMWRIEDFLRAEEIAAGSPAWGLDLCLGCCSEMAGGAVNVRAMIEHFGPRGRIVYVHFRDVQGSVPTFAECFLGEGNYDPAEVMGLLKRVRFTGFLLDDHVPHMDDDTAWGHRARAHAVGYMQGLLAAVK